MIWFIPGLLILVMNAYVIFKILYSNKNRRNNQLIATTTSTAKNNPSSSATTRRVSNPSVQEVSYVFRKAAYYSSKISING